MSYLVQIYRDGDSLRRYPVVTDMNDDESALFVNLEDGGADTAHISAINVEGTVVYSEDQEGPVYKVGKDHLTLGNVITVKVADAKHTVTIPVDEKIAYAEKQVYQIPYETWGSQ